MNINKPNKETITRNNLTNSRDWGMQESNSSNKKKAFQVTQKKQSIKHVVIFKKRKPQIKKIKKQPRNPKSKLWIRNHIIRLKGLLESIRGSNYGDTPFKNVTFINQTGRKTIDRVFAKICKQRWRRAIRTSRKIDAAQ